MRVVFGPGRVAEVAAEVDRLGVHRVFLIADGQAKELADGRWPARRAVAGRWHEVVQHVPVELAERGRAAVTASGADGIVCLGGSSTGLAKAIALSHALPIVAVPTTYAGSEMTTIYGLTGGRHKQTGTSPGRAAQDGRLRPAAHDRPARQRHRCQRVQRPRSLRRGAVRHRLQPGHDGTGAGGGAGDRSLATGGDGRPRRRRRAQRPALRRLPVGHRPRNDERRAAPQAVPRPRRHVQPRPRRRPRRRPPHAVAFNAPPCPTRWPASPTPCAPGATPPVPSGISRCERRDDRSRRPRPTADDLPEAAQRAAEEITDNPVAVDADALLGILRPRRHRPQQPTGCLGDGGLEADRRRSVSRRFSPSSAPGRRGVRGGGPRRAGRRPKGRPFVACRGGCPADLLGGSGEILERRGLHPRLPVAVQRPHDVGERSGPPPRASSTVTMLE